MDIDIVRRMVDDLGCILWQDGPFIVVYRADGETVVFDNSEYVLADGDTDANEKLGGQKLYQKLIGLYGENKIAQKRREMREGYDYWDDLFGANPGPEFDIPDETVYEEE